MSESPAKKPAYALLLSHSKDRDLREQLGVYLAPLAGMGRLRDRLLDAEEEIFEDALREAAAVVLVASPDALAAEAVISGRLAKICERHDLNNLWLMTARPCAWKLIPKLSDWSLCLEAGRPWSMDQDSQADEELTAFVYRLFEATERAEVCKAPETLDKVDEVPEPALNSATEPAPSPETTDATTNRTALAQEELPAVGEVIACLEPSEVEDIDGAKAEIVDEAWPDESEAIRVDALAEIDATIAIIALAGPEFEDSSLLSLVELALHYGESLLDDGADKAAAEVYFEVATQLRRLLNSQGATTGIEKSALARFSRLRLKKALKGRRKFKAGDNDAQALVRDLGQVLAAIRLKAADGNLVPN